MNTPSKPCARGLTEAAALLTSAGYTVIAPVDPSSVIPAVAVGQVWVSPRPGVEARTVTSTTSVGAWVRPFVTFTKPSDPVGMKYPNRLTPEAFRTWARKTGARPVSV